MSRAPLIVYVETNWLVAYVLPHDAWCSAARALLDAAERGECELRIPEVAFVEARHVVHSEIKDHGKAVTAIAASFSAAGESLGKPELQELARKVLEAEASYRPANALRDLATLVERTKGFGFFRPIEEQIERDRLRPRVEMRGADVVDMHLLAAPSARTEP